MITILSICVAIICCLYYFFEKTMVKNLQGMPLWGTKAFLSSLKRYIVSARASDFDREVSAAPELNF